MVGRLRARFDPSAKVGLAAHITVLYPFVPPDQISKAVIARVSNVAQEHSPFAYSLNSIDRFANTLYLRPHPAEPFIDLVKGLVHHFPAYLPMEAGLIRSLPTSPSRTEKVCPLRN